MKHGKINWLLDTDGKYKKTLRGYSAAVAINPDGSATLTVIGAGAPAPATFPTRAAAKNGFRKFLYAIPMG
jgi:hypothetical protein